MRILLKVFAQVSHHNTTFPFARAISEAGHEVIYATVPALTPIVASQGFKVVTQKEDFIPAPTVRRPEDRPSALTRLKLTLAFYSTPTQVRTRIERCCAFDELIGRIRPEVVLVDSPYAAFALSLFKTGLPFALLETTVALDHVKGLPPLSSRRMPAQSFAGLIANEFAWKNYLFRRRMKAYFGFDSFFSRKTIARAAKNGGFSTSEVHLERYLQYGLPTVPELVLSPPEFDFPRPLPRNRIYVGATVDLHRSESGYDFLFKAHLGELIHSRANGTPTVYCALGTAAWRYVGVAKFYQRLIAASVGQKWTLVLAMPDIDRRVYGKIPPNVHIYDAVPQLEMLRNCDLMINHGGLNSITECIMMGVPCVVFPGGDELDQTGNGARVLYHGIGLCGDLRYSTIMAIRDIIVRALGNPSYRSATHALADRILRRVKMSRPVDALNEVIKWRR